MENVKINEWTISCICAEAQGVLTECARLNDMDYELQMRAAKLSYIMGVVGEYFCYKDSSDLEHAQHAYEHAIAVWHSYKKDMQ